MNKQMTCKENNLTVGQPVSVLWRYDQVTKTIFWLGTGEYLGKRVPDEMAVGLNSELCRMANVPCEAVMMPSGEVVFGTEFFIFPMGFWKTNGAKNARVVQACIDDIRKACSEQQPPMSHRPARSKYRNFAKNGKPAEVTI